MTHAVLEDGTDWTLQNCIRVLDGDAGVSLAASTRDRMQASFEHFSNRAQTEDIYGVNTGLGPIVTTSVDRDNLIEQQYQLIFSHASGMGAPLSPRFARATALARAKSMSAGLSAIRPDLPELLCKYLNHDVAPVIPRHGGVGASGDLVQLAHLGLGMIGHGQLLSDGGLRPAENVFQSILDCRPLELAFRDALSICNGTSCMTGIAMANIADSAKLLDHALDLSAALAAVTGTSDEPFSLELSSAKRHSGQARIAEELRHRKARLPVGGTLSGLRPLQEHYSVRCTPQILGAIEQTIRNASLFVLDEFNSVSDNPVFDHSSDSIVHGGNFHGDPVAAAMDQLKGAIVKMTMLFERQLNFLVNDDVNKIFPPFLNRGKIGVDFGFQGAQFTAVSTTAHSQSLAFPMGVHSIPSNKDNQDIVSMGTDAGLMTAEVIENAFSVLSILSVAVSQALDIGGIGTSSANGPALEAATRCVFDHRLSSSLSDKFATVAGDLKAYRPSSLELIA